MSGRVADGTVLTEMSAPGYVRWAREQIDTGRAAAGRTDPHRVTGYAGYAPDRDAVSPLVAAELRSGGTDDQLARAGLLSSIGAVREALRDDDALAAALSDEWLDQLTISGPEDARRCATPVPTRRY